VAAKEAPKAEEEAAISEVSCILLDGYTVNHGQIRGGKGEEAKQPNAKVKDQMQRPHSIPPHKSRFCGNLK
jgi:hypothetical protein